MDSGGNNPEKLSYALWTSFQVCKRFGAGSVLRPWGEADLPTRVLKTTLAESVEEVCMILR